MAESAQGPDRPAKPKSLWEVMSHDPKYADAAPEPEAASKPAAASPKKTEPPKLKSLWALMGSKTPAVPAEVATTDTAATLLRDEETSKVDQIISSPQRPKAASRQSAAASQSKASADKSLSESINIRTTTRRAAEAESSSKAKWSIGLGISAIALSALAFLPGMWTKFPALAIGFFGLFSGFLAADEIRTSRGRQVGMNVALTGMGVSLLGMFIGPLMAWGLGDLLMFQSDRQATTARLETIGAAVHDHYEEQRQFPVGGVFLAQAGGPEKPMHGWMTELLPYLGHDRIYRKVNLSIPFDHQQNVAAMRHQIPEYLIAGVEQTTSVNQYGAAHFAGVGGQTSDVNGGVTHFGVFERNSAVFRDDVTDGLSNTFLAGEIPGSFPAWGEPENWRTITEGLNRDQRGFGSSQVGPTLFLMADGSVRSVSPETDLSILKALCTRDGED